MQMSGSRRTHIDQWSTVRLPLIVFCSNCNLTQWKMCRRFENAIESGNWAKLSFDMLKKIIVFAFVANESILCQLDLESICIFGRILFRFFFVFFKNWFFFQFFSPRISGQNSELNGYFLSCLEELTEVIACTASSFISCRIEPWMHVILTFCWHFSISSRRNPFFLQSHQVWIFAVAHVRSKYVCCSSVSCGSYRKIHRFFHYSFEVVWTLALFREFYLYWMHWQPTFTLQIIKNTSF